MIMNEKDHETACILESSLAKRDYSFISEIKPESKWGWVLMARVYTAKSRDPYFSIVCDYDFFYNKNQGNVHDFNTAVIDFINWNFSLSNNKTTTTPFGQYKNLAIMALRYCVFHRKHELIKNGTYPIDTEVYLPLSSQLLEIYNHVTEHNKKQQYWETHYILALAEAMTPRPHWTKQYFKEEHDPKFIILAMLIYGQSESFYCEKIILKTKESKEAYKFYIEENHGYFRHSQRAEKVGDKLLKLINDTCCSSRESVLDDRLSVGIKLYSMDKHWECVRCSQQLCYFVNKKLGRIAFTSNLDFDRIIGYCYQHSCFEICFSDNGDYISVINLKDALKKLSLLIALSNGECYPQYKIENIFDKLREDFFDQW